MTIDEAREHIGDGVVIDVIGFMPEDGIITGTSDRFVFVRYSGEVHAKATRPEDLTLLMGDFRQERP